MDTSSKEYFATAAAMLQNATGCQPSVAAQIVNLIALGTIRWAAESSDKGLSFAQKAVHNQQMHAAWQAGYDTAAQQRDT
jgi:hypothetical protein